MTIHVPESERYYAQFIVWDMKAILLKINTLSTDQMQFLSKHVPVSVSVCSNVEGFCEPKCFVDISSDNLILMMMSYLNDISSSSLGGSVV